MIAIIVSFIFLGVMFVVTPKIFCWLEERADLEGIDRVLICALFVLLYLYCLDWAFPFVGEERPSPETVPRGNAPTRDESASRCERSTVEIESSWTQDSRRTSASTSAGRARRNRDAYR